ncbi:MAG: hypothetical protein KKB25_04045, partial [Nanoarchaeota archaeon]|nr:hypothetical protein [Nanoarchaeota archaeon]
NKKILILLAIILIAILAIAIIAIKQKRAVQNPEITKQELQQKFQLIKSQYEKAKADGYDVSEIEKIGRQAKQAFDKGDYGKADTLVKRIFNLLGKTEIPETSIVPPISTPVPIDNPTPTPSVSSLSQVKNAIVYERISDNRPKRTESEIAQIIKETNADLVFRADWRWFPKYGKCSELSGNDIQLCTQSGMSYEIMKSYYDAIYKENPAAIIVAAIPTQHINSPDKNELTNETISSENSLAMALDPTAYGFSATKEEFQAMFNGQFQGNSGYYPDINNPAFQELFLSWVKNQINIGANALWYDLLFYQSNAFLRMTNKNPDLYDFTNPAVIKSFKSASYLVDETHKYAQSVGKKVYIGSWSVSMYYSQKRPDLYTQPKLDFVTIAPKSEEIISGNYNDAYWNKFKTDVYAGFGNIPILVFFDWGFANSQTEVFANMDKTAKTNALQTIAAYFKNKGMIFVYPVHGGNVVSGKSSIWYDSKNPTIDIYDTIKDLMNKK